MTDPQSFDTSWRDAEETAFNRLVEATGTVAAKSAFLGLNPGVVNAWHLESQAVADIGESVLLARDIPSLGIPYRAECAFTRREDCQAWAMRILRGLPVCRDGDSNVAVFRVRHFGQIVPDTVAAGNEGAAVGVWKMEVGLDLVFSTGGKGNGAV